MTLSRLLIWRCRPSTTTVTTSVVLSGKSAHPLVVHVVGRDVRSKTTVGRLPQPSLGRESQGLHIHDDLRANPLSPAGIHGRNFVGEGTGVDLATPQSLQDTLLFVARQAAADPPQIRQSPRGRTADQYGAQSAGAVGLPAPPADWAPYW